MRDYYAVLGVSPGAEVEVITAAYRALMKKYHPDTSGSQGDDRAREIIEAYSVLSDPQKRNAYDSTRKSKAQSEKAGGQQQSKKSTPPPPPPPPPPKTEPAIVEKEGSPFWMIALLFIIPVVLILSFLPTAAQNTDVEDAMIAENVVDVLEPAELETEVEAIPEEAPRKLSEITMPSASYSHVERGARRFADILQSHGIQGARTYSEACHQHVTAKPSWSAADFCAAFDYAAAYLDGGFSRVTDSAANSYFSFQAENQDQAYVAAGAMTYALTSRLTTIKDTAERVVTEAIQERVARNDAKRAKEAAAEAAPTPSTPANENDSMVVAAPDQTELERIFGNASN